jgi:hypothetical protein
MNCLLPDHSKKLPALSIGVFFTHLSAKFNFRTIAKELVGGVQNTSGAAIEISGLIPVILP